MIFKLYCTYTSPEEGVKKACSWVLPLEIWVQRVCGRVKEPAEVTGIPNDSNIGWSKRHTEKFYSFFPYIRGLL